MSVGSRANKSSGNPDRIALAVALVMGSMLTLSVMDALIKDMTDAFSLWQVCTARAFFAVPTLVVIVARAGRAQLAQVLNFWVTMRSLLIVGAWAAYYSAIPLLDLSVAATALYTFPLFVAGFVSVFAREPVGWRKWLGIVMGFAGVVVILRPGGDEFSLWALLPVLAALLYALACVITRYRCPDESAFVIGLSLNVALMVFGSIGSIVVMLVVPDTADGFVLRQWHPMTLADWGVMAGFGVAMVLITAGVARAYQSAPSAMVGTFDYSYLVFVSLWGVLFFDERLDMTVALGVLLIISAGLLVLWQPRRLAIGAAPAGE